VSSASRLVRHLELERDARRRFEAEEVPRPVMPRLHRDVGSPGFRRADGVAEIVGQRAGVCLTSERVVSVPPVAQNVSPCGPLGSPMCPCAMTFHIYGGQVEGMSFEAFFEDEYSRLVRAFLLVGKASETEELAQEALARMFERWARVREMDSPVGNLYRVAFNVNRRQMKTIQAACRRPRPGVIAWLGAGAPCDVVFRVMLDAL
jgi:hypothetical protein